MGGRGLEREAEAKAGGGKRERELRERKEGEEKEPGLGRHFSAGWCGRKQLAQAVLQGSER